MSLNSEFDYNESLFDPPAPVVAVELRSPASPEANIPERMIAQIDSGSPVSFVPEPLIQRLRLCKVDEVDLAGYNAEKEDDFVTTPVYSVQLIVSPLGPVLARVSPLSQQTFASQSGYGIIGRDIINEWLLTLDGPKLKAYLKSTIEPASCSF